MTRIQSLALPGTPTNRTLFQAPFRLSKREERGVVLDGLLDE